MLNRLKDLCVGHEKMRGEKNMNMVFRQTQLYNFLRYCNECELERVVLDCGAGGNMPPLALFARHGYKTFGLEIDDTALLRAKAFEQENGYELHITKGDMRKLPFEDGSISFIYSYNTIFHMKKQDIAEAIQEMKRILRPGGLIFVNFLSHHDFGYGEGEETGKGEYLQMEGGRPTLHVYHEDDEAEAYFEDMAFLLKENRVLKRLFEGEKIRQGYIDYIVKKR